MGTAELVVALVALVISLIAMTVTAFQLSAQIFSTAEGQRKCSESLLSLWSKDPTTRTHWKWRWSEARYETKFVTPEIYLSNSATPIPEDRGDNKVKKRNQLFPPFCSLRTREKKSNRKTESVLGADFRLDYVLFISAFADDAPDMVSWLRFLTFLRLGTRDASAKILPGGLDGSRPSIERLGKAPGPKIFPLELSWPRIKYRVHSWDFMPPNAPKPLASITVHDIAVLVRRTGMAWKTFDPKNGNMSAEGGGHILTGTVVQGMGLVLEYRCLDDKRLARGVSTEIRTMRGLLKKSLTRSQMKALEITEANALEQHDFGNDEESQRSKNPDTEQRDERDRKAQRSRLWVKEMDKFIFGLIPGDSRLGLPDFPHAEDSDCFHVLVTLNEGNTNMRDQLMKETSWNWRWAFHDLLYICPPVLRVRHGGTQRLSFKGWSDHESIIKRTLDQFVALLRAFLNGGTKVHESPVACVKRAFPKLPEEELRKKMLGEKGLLAGRIDGGTQQMKRVLAGVEEMARHRPDGTIRTRPVCEWMHDDHDSTTQYFVENKTRINFYDLLKAHFSKAPAAGGEARRTEKDAKYILKPGGARAWFYPNLELYFSYIPDYIDFMKRKYASTEGLEGCHDEDLIIEAWFTLMWRGYLFVFLHDLQTDFDGIYVPHEYYGSRLPVYMA